MHRVEFRVDGRNFATARFRGNGARADAQQRSVCSAYTMAAEVWYENADPSTN